MEELKKELRRNLDREKEIELRAYKRRSINTARELFYSEEVIQRIRNAKTEYEVTKALHEARLSY